MGGVPHAAPHLRLAAVRPGPQRRAGPAVARSPLAGVHAHGYVHLLDGDLGAPLPLPECQQVATQATEPTRNSPDSIAAEVPQIRAITQ